MICLDTTFLIDLWRNQGTAHHPTHELLRHRSGEIFAVPPPSAGEFLEGAIYISEARFQNALWFLRQFQTGTLTFETAQHYARIVSGLRRQNRLGLVSKFDLWNAAWAREQNAELITKNVRHYQGIPGLKITSY